MYDRILSHIKIDGVLCVLTSKFLWVSLTSIILKLTVVCLF